MSGLFWLGVAIFVCVESIDMAMGTLGNPGPGFFVFCWGTVLGTFAIVLVVTATLKKKRETEIRNLWSGMKWGKVSFALVALLIYSIFLPKMGYLITTFGLMILLFGLAGGTRVWVQIVSSLMTTLGTYIVFKTWLNVLLPKGILGF